MSGQFLADDLATFFNVDDFADAATFDGSAVEVSGILDKAFDLAQIGAVDVASTAPVFTLKSSDLPSNVRGRFLRFGNLLAGGSRYRVMADHADGTGVTMLVLQDA